MTCCYRKILPENVLTCSTWDKLNSPILNKGNIQEFIWVYIPHEFSTGYVVTSIEHKHKNEYEPLDLAYVERDHYYPWIKIIAEKLVQDVGQHIYRLILTHETTLESVTLYFSYTIQNDDPEKPYYYMGKYRGEK